MSLRNGSDYYKKMMDLQDRLRRSEEERIRLEQRFSLLEHESRSRHETCINRLRMRYIEFLEEQQMRDERNYKLLGALDRVDNNLAVITARTNRLGVLRKQFEASILRSEVNGRPNESLAGDSGIVSQNNEKLRKYYDFRLGDNNFGSETSRGSILEHRAIGNRDNSCVYKRRPSLPIAGNASTRYRDADNDYRRSEPISRLLSNENNLTIGRKFSEPKSARYRREMDYIRNRERFIDRGSPIFHVKRSSDYEIPGSTIGEGENQYLTTNSNDFYRRASINRHSFSPTPDFFNLHPSGYSRRFPDTGGTPGFSERFNKDSEGEDGVQRSSSIPEFLEKREIRVSDKVPLKKSMQHDNSVRKNEEAEGECVGKIVENELERYITKIRSLHRDADPRSLEDIDHEQNTSGDLLNVTLSEDGADLSIEERSKETGIRIPCGFDNSTGIQKSLFDSKSGKHSFEADKESRNREIGIDEIANVATTSSPEDKRDTQKSNVMLEDTRKSNETLENTRKSDDRNIQRNLSTRNLLENGEYNDSEGKIVSPDERGTVDKHLLRSVEEIESTDVRDLEKKVKEMILKDTEEVPRILEKSNQDFNEKTDDFIEKNDDPMNENQYNYVDTKYEEFSVDPNNSQEYEQQNKGYAQNSGQDYVENSEGYVPDSNQRYLMDPGQVYAENTEGYAPDSNEIYAENQEGYAQDSNQIYAENQEEYTQDCNQIYAENQEGYAQDSNEIYAENQEGYAQDSNQVYAENQEGYVPDSDQRYPVDPNQVYAENPEVYAQDSNQIYTENPDGYAPDSNQSYPENPEGYAPNSNEIYTENLEGYVPDSNQHYPEEQENPQYAQESIYEQREGQACASDNNYVYPTDGSEWNPGSTEIYHSNAAYEEQQAQDYVEGGEDGTELDKRDPSIVPGETKIAQNDVPIKKTKDVIKSLLDSDTESTMEKNVSNAESDFDFN